MVGFCKVVLVLGRSVFGSTLVRITEPGSLIHFVWLLRLNC